MYLIDYVTLPQQQMSCNYDSGSVGADISGIIAITRGNEYHLQSAVATAGPVSVAVDATPNSFRVRQLHM